MVRTVHTHRFTVDREIEEYVIVGHLVAVIHV
jgi:hypothetical protein